VKNNINRNWCGFMALLVAVYLGALLWWRGQ
jgi:hypothetical protein